MLKHKKGNSIDNRSIINKKKVNNKNISFSRYKLYLSIIFILLGIFSLILIPSYFHDLEVYSKVIFSIFIVISLVIIFTDKVIINKIKSLLEYIKDSTRELSKVVWPDKRMAMTMSIMVVIFVTILSLFIWGVDSLVSWLFYDILLRR